MKHLKLRGTLVPAPEGYKVRVTILEQTHRNSDFARSNPFYHNNFELGSYAYPEYTGGRCLYLRGSNIFMDDNPVVVPLDIWKQIKEAVKAYNEAYKE